MVAESQVAVEPQSEAGIRMAGLVREAWLAASELGEEVAQETREAAFKMVLEALLRNGGIDQPVTESLGNGSTGDAPDDTTDDDLYSTPELRGDAISYYLDISRDAVELLFDLDPEPSLSYSGKGLSQKKQPATREIAMLVLAGRNAVGLDTTADEIRSAVEYYKKLDSPNFMSTLQNSPVFVVLGRPRKGKRVVRLRDAGVEAAKELAKRLVSE